ITADLRLTNLTASPITASVEIYDDAGKRLTGYELDNVQITVAGSGIAFRASSGNGPMISGSMIIRVQGDTLEGGILSPLAASLTIQIPGLGIASIPSSPLIRNLVLPVQRLNGTRTAIAITNGCQQSILISGTLRDQNGHVFKSIQLNISPTAH